MTELRCDRAPCHKCEQHLRKGAQVQNTCMEHPCAMSPQRVKRHGEQASRRGAEDGLGFRYAD
jgi:hypothetical protein